MFRFTVGFLCAVVAVAALGCAALIYPSLWLAKSLISLALLSVLAFLTISLFGSERWRAGAAGFSIFAGAYFLLVFLPVVQIRHLLITDEAARVVFGAIKDQLLSDVGDIEYVDMDRAYLDRRMIWQIYTSPASPPERVRGLRDEVIEQRVKAFSDIAHALWTILVGIAGSGFTALVCAAAAPTNSKSPRARYTPTPSTGDKKK